MKQFATPQTVANEVRMKRTQHAGTFLIVEGDTDKKTCRGLVDQHECQIVIAHGKPNLLGALTILEHDQFNGVVAICDADFSRLEGPSSASTNLLLTDAHDLEGMMIASPAFTKVLGEFAIASRVDDFEKRVGFPVATALAKNAVPVGCLRWLSLRHSLQLRFEGLTYARFLDRDALTVDTGKLLRAVKDHSQRHDLELADSQIIRKIEALLTGGHDPSQVSCGHDMLDILSFGLRRTLAARSQADVNRESLERSLRLAYDESCFTQTTLCQSIRCWEQANAPYRVLPAVVT